jgi:hypothetical protein
MRPEARAILAAAPTPADAAQLTVPQLRALLRKAGRRNRIDTDAARLHEVFRAPQMRQPPLVEDAMGRQALALLRQLDAACAAAADLEQAVTESLGHPGNLGGHETWEDAGSWRHSGNTRMSCANAR